MPASRLDTLIDALNRPSAAQVRLDRAAEWNTAAAPSCGNCDHWMKKRECPREARGGKPSMNSAPCGSYAENRHVADYREKATAERQHAIDILEGRNHAR